MSQAALYDIVSLVTGISVGAGVICQEYLMKDTRLDDL